MALIDELIKNEWLKTPGIIRAFREIKRADFMPEDIKHLAELNEALPIGQGQTISQPLVVAFMMELLQPAEGDKILDIGSGSGWTSALLGELVGPQGKIFSLEIVPGLKRFGENNVAKYNFISSGRVEFLEKDGSKGYAEQAPFDRILCSAAAQKEIPTAWKKQLKNGGKIVTPLGTFIVLLTKESEDKFTKEEYSGFAFVPLIER